jgi:parallel beta-helix repeat protein
VKCQLLLIRGQRYVTVTGGTLIGSRNGTPSFGMGIVADDSQDLLFENMTLRDFFFDGMILTGNTGCARVTVRGCAVMNSRRTGLAIVHAAGVTVEGSTFNGTHGQSPQSGVNIEPNRGEAVQTVKLSHCTMKGNAGMGVYIHAPFTDVSVANSLIAGNYYGIVSSGGGQGVTLTDNRVTDQRNAITLGALRRATVTGNWLENNFRGIFTSGATNVEVRGNTIVGTGPAAAENGGTGGDGIVCTGGQSTEPLPNACTVVNNTVRRSAGNGIVAQLVSHVSISNNTVDEAGSRGLHLRSTQDSDVKDNTISGTGEEPPPQRFDAIEVEHGSHANNIVGNVIHRSFGMRKPIGIAADSGGNRVQLNTVAP